jgi:hypothetical protein
VKGQDAMQSRSSSHTTVHWFLIGLFILIFLGSMVLGIRELFDEHTFLSKAELDDGVITDYMVDSSGRNVLFCPIIDFTTKAGEKEEYEGASCENHPQAVPIGKHVQVRFDPLEPNRFQTDKGSPFLDYLDGSFALFFGFLFLAIAMMMLAIDVAKIMRERHWQRNANVAATYRASNYPDQPKSGEASEAKLLAEQARLQAAEAEVQRQLDERRFRSQ